MPVEIGDQYTSDLTDTNYSVCSSHLFSERGIKYVLSISYVGPCAFIFQVTQGGYGITIGKIDCHAPRFLLKLAKCLKKFGLVRPGVEVLEHRIAFKTELCDPEEATVYNALFDDVVQLSWK